MKRAILIFIGIVALSVTAFIALRPLTPTQASKKLGPDTVFLGSSALTFSEALPQLMDMLNKSTREKLEVLSALKSNTSLVKSSTLQMAGR